MPRNRWLAAAALWFAASTYALVFRDGGSNPAPPFPHFDKLAHALLFFAQIWLSAKIWLTAQRRVPFQSLFVFGLCCALASEAAQHWFTRTRQGDVWDAAADMLGVCAALYLAARVQTARQNRTKHLTDRNQPL